MSYRFAVEIKILLRVCWLFFQSITRWCSLFKNVKNTDFFMSVDSRVADPHSIFTDRIQDFPQSFDTDADVSGQNAAFCIYLKLLK
jgi:hypothetical protein